MSIHCQQIHKRQQLFSELPRIGAATHWNPSPVHPCTVSSFLAPWVSAHMCAPSPPVVGISSFLSSWVISAELDSYWPVKAWQIKQVKHLVATYWITAQWCPVESCAHLEPTCTWVTKRLRRDSRPRSSIQEAQRGSHPNVSDIVSGLWSVNICPLLLILNFFA